MYKKIVNLTLVLILGFTFVVPVSAQTKLEKIKEDIRIMETILEQLLESSRNYSFNGRNIKGFYFDDYGLLFNVNMENNFHILSFVKDGEDRISIINQKRLELEEKAKNQDEKRRGVVVSPSPRKYSPFGLGIDKAEFKEWEKKLDKKIRTFISAYVDNGNFLGANDKVSVVVFFGNQYHEGPKAKVFQTKKGEILDVRRERISESDFDKRLSKQLISGDDHGEEIDIMSEIIKTSLERKKRSKYLWGGTVHGIFLKELGVMFSFGDRYFRDIFADDFQIWTVPETEDFLDELRAEVIIEKSKKKKTEEDEKFRENLSKFEDDIIKIIGQYGTPSFKFLSNDQSVFVLFGTEGYSSKNVSNIMIRLKKSDLVSYSRDQLSLENLRKRAQIVEY